MKQQTIQYNNKPHLIGMATRKIEHVELSDECEKVYFRNDLNIMIWTLGAGFLKRFSPFTTGQEKLIDCYSCDGFLHIDNLCEPCKGFGKIKYTIGEQSIVLAKDIMIQTPHVINGIASILNKYIILAELQE